MSDARKSILEFLRACGLTAVEGLVPQDSFLPGLRIERGTLVFDTAQLRWPGDLLHEAGHVAVTPADRRSSLSDPIDSVQLSSHGGELEAIAWSYAAVVELGLPHEVLFHPEGYRGQSAGLLLSTSLGVYPGAFGLAQAGMTLLGGAAQDAGVPPYPHMLRWLRA